jgi:hypothetical protein
MIEAFYQVLLQGRKPHPYMAAASSPASPSPASQARQEARQAQQQTFGSHDYGAGGIIKLGLCASVEKEITAHTC